MNGSVIDKPPRNVQSKLEIGPESGLTSFQSRREEASGEGERRERGRAREGGTESLAKGKVADGVGL